MTRIDVVVADIADVEQHQAEAYVVAANNELWMGAGVAGALKRAAGGEVEREAVEQGPIAVGEAILTSAGRMPPPARALIHAAAMGFTDRTQIYASPESVAMATVMVLELCLDNDLRSVVFPALGTGVGGLDIEDAAKTMAMVLHAFLAAHPEALDHVRFVVTTDERRAVFESALRGSSS
jgi:O-acetyl-ADP-ribose deacetylase (regulator of RNase III)